MIEGDFFASITGHDFEMNFAGLWHLNPLGSMGVSGVPSITSAGLVSNLLVAVGASLGFAGVSFLGEFFFAVNATASAALIKVLNVDKHTGMVHGQKDMLLGRKTLILGFGGEVRVGSFSIVVLVMLTPNTSKISVVFMASLDLGLLGNFRIEGSTEIGHADYFAMCLDQGADVLKIGPMSMSASFVLEFNASNQAMVFNNGAMTQTVAANAICTVVASEIDSWVLKISISASITHSNGTLFLDFAGSLNFFDVLKMSVEGHT